MQKSKKKARKKQGKNKAGKKARKKRSKATCEKKRRISGQELEPQQAAVARRISAQDTGILGSLSSVT